MSIEDIAVDELLGMVAAMRGTVKDVVPHIKRGRRYAEKSMDGGKAARFVDMTLPKHVADKILEIDKGCRKMGI